MKNWDPKFFIVYPRILIDRIQWPEGADYRCSANLSSMLRFVLSTKSIGGEIKIIWNYEHRKVIMEKNDVTSEDVDNYVKADSGMISFTSERMRDKAAKVLTNIGGENFVYVNSYRDVILQQAYYFINKEFKNKKQ